MILGELIVNSPVASGSPTSVSITGNIPVNITLAIADVREPDKRNSSFSKTISLPGDKTINTLFEHIFEVTTDLNNFNPNLKTFCQYYVRSEKVFEGDLQLLKIKKKGISPYTEITYEVSIVGRLANVFLDLGNALLTDLDFSDLNHTFSYANRNWTPTIGTGYTYPLADYGCWGASTAYWNFAFLKPAIFEREYIDRIFESIGKTFSGTYMTSTYEKSILIPDTNEGALKMSNSQINGVSFYAGKTADTTYNIPLTYNPFWGQMWYTNGNMAYAGVGNFNDDSTTPFYDGGNNYNVATFYYTSPVAFNIGVKTQLNFEVRVNAPATTNNMIIDQGQYNFTAIIDFNGLTQTMATVSVVPNFTSWTSFSISVSAPNVPIPQGQPITVLIYSDDANAQGTFFFNGFVPVIAGTASIDLKLLSTSWFSATSADGFLPIGYTVDMNKTVPKNIKQIDFLMGVIKAENLYMELDLTDPNNYIIEKRVNFFQTTNPLDWTDKWDFERETEVIPMGELDWREYLYTYKKDGDKFNKLYFEEYGEVYGQELIRVDNDFIRNQKKQELIFSATPMVGNALNNLVYPMYAQIDGNTIKPMACNIRRLYWGGVIQPPGVGFWYMINASSSQSYDTFSTFPYAGTIQNPYNDPLLPAQFSLDWGIPRKLYYNYPSNTYTNDNLYTRNYQEFIEQITDPNSKIVVMWMYLKASDISKFTFRKRIWIHDSYYLCNKIIEYNPQEIGPCKVELLRLVAGETPVPEPIDVWLDGEVGGIDVGIIVSNPGSNPNGVYSESDGLVSGYSNNNQGSQSNIIGGFGNQIGGFGEA
jgi:hypothetical protein